MDVIVPYGIKYKKCGQVSFSGYKKTQIIPFLQKNLYEKKSETVMAIVAELHCSSYYNELENFIINFFSNHLILSDLTYCYFICKYFQKIKNLKSIIKKKNQNIALINSNEMRNIYCSIFSNFIENKHHKFFIKIEPKCFLDEIYLLHTNLHTFNLIVDDNNVTLSDKMSRGLREILYWIENPKISVDTVEKILYWIHWCIKIEGLEKKIYKGENLAFNSDLSVFKKIKICGTWEIFLWTKVWQANQKNNFMNKLLLKSLTKLFFHKYNHSKLKDRAGLLSLAILICNLDYKIKVERKISKMEIFTSINANMFYKNINIEDDNDQKYLEEYNYFNNIKSSTDVKKLYKMNTIEQKMDFLRDYIPKEENKNNIKNVSEYFS